MSCMENLSHQYKFKLKKHMVQKTGFKSLSIQVLGRILRDMKFERVKRNGVYGYLVKEKKILNLNNFEISVTLLPFTR